MDYKSGPVGKIEDDRLLLFMFSLVFLGALSFGVLLGVLLVGVFYGGEGALCGGGN